MKRIANIAPFARLTAKICLLSVLLFFSGCVLRKRVPLGTIPAAQPWSAQMRQAGAEAVVSKIRNLPLDNNPAHIARVNTVLSGLFRVIDSPDRWEVFIVQTPVWNAFCAPGNYIIVYSGLLDQVQSNDELAAVLAHEISHDLGRHPGNPGQQLLAALSLAAGQAVGNSTYRKTGNKEEAERDAKAVAAIGHGLFVLPYGRDQETEADEIGLFMMAEAGFNPESAITLWQKQARQGDLGALDFLSTHPASSRRAAELAKIVPLAKQRYLTADRGSSGIAAAKQSQIQKDNFVPVINNQANNYLNIGLDYLRAESYQAAEQNISSALKIEPKSVIALNGLAVAELRQGDVKKSMNTLSKASKIAPMNATTLYNLACAHSLQGKKDTALNYLAKAVEVNPQLRDSAANDPDFAGIKNDPRFLAKTNSGGNRGRATFVINRFD